MTRDWLILNYFSRAEVTNVWKLSIPIHYIHVAHKLSSYMSSRCGNFLKIGTVKAILYVGCKRNLVRSPRIHCAVWFNVWMKDLPVMLLGICEMHQNLRTERRIFLTAAD